MRPSGRYCTSYNAGAYSGITFWAKGQPGTVFFYVGTVDTVPVDYGGICTVGCMDYHRGGFNVTTEWQQFSFTWDQLMQQLWGTQVSLNVTQMVLMGFALPRTSFDFYLDDVAFTE